MKGRSYTERKTDWSSLASIVLCLLGPSVIWLYPSRAGVVWSDNFDDGDYDGWTVTSGMFSPEGNTLKAVSEGSIERYQSISEGSNVVAHPSTVATGTWSFDVYVTDDGGGEILFVVASNRTYMIDITSDTVYLWRRGIDGEGRRVEGKMLKRPYIVRDPFSGWQHIDVTRDENGRILVYHEGELVIGDSFLAIGSYDTLLTTSQNFLYIAPSPGIALDNIVVSNTIDVFPPPIGRIDRSQWRFWATMIMAAITVAAIRMDWINRTNSLDAQKTDDNID